MFIVRALISVLALLPFLAFGMELSCRGELNGAEQFRTLINLPTGQRMVPVGQIGELEIFLSAVGDQQVELQLYNPLEPSRSYATAALRSAGERVQLAFWSRAFWIEVQCSKI